VTLSKQDGNQLRLNFFMQIRDSLKKKLDSNVMVSQEGRKKKEGQYSLHGMVLDDPEIN
jgi:hypothetical protein